MTRKAEKKNKTPTRWIRDQIRAGLEEVEQTMAQELPRDVSTAPVFMGIAREAKTRRDQL